MAAPASAAPTAASAISWAVTGRCGDIEGVWMAPVTAQVMMTLRVSAKLLSDLAGGVALVAEQRHQAAGAPAVGGGQGPGGAGRTTRPLGSLRHRPPPAYT